MIRDICFVFNLNCLGKVLSILVGDWDDQDNFVLYKSIPMQIIKMDWDRTRFRLLMLFRWRFIFVIWISVIMWRKDKKNVIIEYQQYGVKQ
jgi:hypothetical protein